MVLIKDCQTPRKMDAKQEEFILANQNQSDFPPSGGSNELANERPCALLNGDSSELFARDEEELHSRRQTGSAHFSQPEAI